MTKEIFLNRLKNLILAFFSADEFRRFVRYLPNGNFLEKLLPGVNSSYLNIASDGTKMLFENGAVKDSFFDSLIIERPMRKDEINKLRGDFHMLH